MPPDAAGPRVHAKDRIEQRPMAYHEQVRLEFILAQAQADPSRDRLVRADRTREEVHADILRYVMELGNNRGPS